MKGEEIGDTDIERKIKRKERRCVRARLIRH